MRELPGLTAPTAAFPPPDVQLSVTLPDLHTPTPPLLTTRHATKHRTSPFEASRPSVPTHVITTCVMGAEQRELFLSSLSFHTSLEENQHYIGVPGSVNLKRSTPVWLRH